MTDVGKISLGVEIHADDLSAKLGEAVRRAIAPALERVQRQLNKTQVEYEKTARASENSGGRQVRALKAVERQAGQTAAAVAAARVSYGRSSAAQSAAQNAATAGARRQSTANDNLTTSTRNVAAAQRELNTAIEIFGKKSPQAAAAQTRLDRAQAKHTEVLIRAAARSRASTDSQVNDYQRLARAAEESAARQAAAEAAANRAAGGGGGGGSGRRGGGVLGFLTSPVGLNGIALAAQALPAMATGLTNIVGAVQQLAQGGLALPGIFAGAAASIGTAVIGFKGVGEATKLMNEALKTGDSKDLEKAKEAMKDMAPAGVALAETLAKLNRGPLLEFRKNIQGRMLDGFSDQVQRLSDRALPRLEGGMGKVADSWKGSLKAITGALGSDESLSFMDQIFGNTAEGQKRANKAIQPLVSAFGNLAKEGSYFLPRLGDAIAKVADRFNAFITKNAANGNIFRWIDEGFNGLRAFGNALLNVGKIITGLTKAAGQLNGSMSGDGGFLGWLEKATGNLATFINSTKGQNKLGEFFRDGRGDMETWGQVLADLAKIIGKLIDGFATWGGVILPIVGALADVVSTLGEIPGLLQAVVVGFMAWRTLGPIIGGLTSKLGGMATAVGATGMGAGAPGSKALNRGLAGASLLGLGTMVQQTSGKEDTSSQVMGGLSNIAGGAMLGAGIGSVIPGVGTAIGAGAGAAVGAAIAGINYLLADNKEAQDAAAEASARLADAQARTSQAFTLTANATKMASDALLESGGAIDSSTISAVGDAISQIPDKLASTQSEDTIKAIASAMTNLDMTTEQLSTVVTGAQPGFDALRGRLDAMGEPGRLLAEQLSALRDSTLGLANNATTAAPLLQTLADAGFGSVTQAAVNVRNALAGIPKDTPINMDMPQGPAVLDILEKIGVEARVDENKNIVVDAPLADDVLKQLQALGYEVNQNNDKTINVSMNQAGYLDTMAKLGDLGAKYREIFDQSFNLPAPPAPAAPTAGPGRGIFALPPKALGGPIWGGVKGVDSVPILAQHGEFVLDTGDVARMGGVEGVERFRRALEFGGRYEDGGPVGHLGTGALPGPVQPDTELAVLIQIRDLLGGKGGVGSNPLAATAANTATAATAAKGATGGVGPFGTPLKKRGDPAYEMAAAAISALGGDPEKWIGMDPATLTTAQGGMLPVTTGLTGTGAASSTTIAALKAFAASGNTADLAGTGLSIGDPVVKALITARGKKKGNLGADGIGDLIDQVLGGGGFQGTVDTSNSALLGSLTTYQKQLAKAGGFAPTAASTGVPLTGLPSGVMDPVSAYASANSGGAYEWGASDLSKGLSDCSGAVSDLVELMTKGAASPERLFSTADARDVLTKLGAVDGAVPGALQIGWDEGHMRSTLPNGVNFESGGGTGQGATYGGNAQGAAGMANVMSLPMGNLPPGVLAAGGATGTGTPVFVTNWPGQGGGIGGQILGAGLTAAGGAAGNVAGDWISAIGGMGQEGYQKRNPNASLDQLLDQNNPMALAAAMGFNVQDFTREGGQGGETEKNDQAYDASGRMFSDTTSLMDRTFSSLQEQLSAMREQLVDVIEQTNQKLADTALEPVIKAGMQSALESLKDSVSNSIGSALGNAAAPPIADAVSSAVSSLPIDNSGGGSIGADAAGIVAKGFAAGGRVGGGTPGKDSVPAMLMPGEYVLNTGQVARMGGFSAIDNIASKGMRHYATGGGVNVNDSVGADFFGVSEVPILSTIINMIVKVLLQVIGIEIEARDTMNEMTDEFRGFRGDAFKAFDAQGRLLNDTSALIERTSSSAETAAEERIRILKIVIEAVIKYIIEKVIVPIGKAVANAAIQAGASAAGAAVNTQAPGAGGIVSSLISSGGQAGVEIVAEIGSDFAVALTGVLTDVIANGIQSAAPDLVNALFGGGLLAGLFDPAGGFISTLVGGFFGAISGLFGGLFGGASTLIPGIPFDQGGMATGKGLMLKDVEADELVMNPTETDLFSRFVRALENGGFGRSSTSVHAPITVIGGGRETAEQVENRLLKLMP